MKDYSWRWRYVALETKRESPNRI